MVDSTRLKKPTSNPEVQGRRKAGEAEQREHVFILLNFQIFSRIIKKIKVLLFTDVIFESSAY